MNDDLREQHVAARLVEALGRMGRFSLNAVRTASASVNASGVGSAPTAFAMRSRVSCSSMWMPP